MATKPQSSCIIGGAIHGTEKVSQRPAGGLSIWQVIEIDAGTRHFVGYDITACEGGVSTAIQRFDPKTRKGVTVSGRTYVVLGSPGYDKDWHWVWNIWKRANRVKAERDVTEEYEILRLRCYRPQSYRPNWLRGEH